MAKKYQPTIGLEIHAELNTVTKMFCGCPNQFSGEPNSLVCPICLGLPGSLPFANEAAIVKSYLIARALGCKLAERTYWERKNYFYPDLPKGYQISQYNLPIGTKGKLAQVTVRRVHLEEDTGKLLHPEGADYSLVDYNRSGVPLVELVTEPKITSAKQATEFAREYQLLLRYLGVSDADMEKGQLRVEANVSVNMGTKVEVKNLNSFRSVERAIAFEVERQTQLIRSGKPVEQETRGWDEINQKTFSQRVKETESDYRYFPEPDLPPISEKLKGEALSRTMLELPDQKREKLMSMAIPKQYIEVLISNKDRLDFVEKWSGEDPKKAPRYAEIAINRPEILTMSEKIIRELADMPNYQRKIALKKGTVEVGPQASQEEVMAAIKQVVREHQKAVEDYRAGKQAVLGFLIGQVLKKIPKNVNPKIVTEQLKSVLGS